MKLLQKQRAFHSSRTVLQSAVKGISVASRAPAVVAGSQIHIKPVGALTSKPYAFTARPWELRSTETVDIMNAMGSHIKIQTRGTELMRVTPRINDEINEEWIDDKTRFSYDGLKYQRLLKPLVRDLNNPSRWDEDYSTWKEAFARVAQVLRKPELTTRAVCGPTIDLYSAVALSDWMGSLSGNDIEVLGSSAKLQSADFQKQFRFNTTIANIDEADLCLLVGTNLPVDAPLLIARLRKGFLSDRLKIASLGFHEDLHFPVENVGLTADKIVDLAEGRHPFCAQLATAKNPIILVDSSVLERSDGRTICGAFDSIASNSRIRQFDEEGNMTWNGLNLMHRNANDVGLLDLGRCVPFKNEIDTAVDFLFLLGIGAEDLPVSADEIKSSAKFIVYQGHHGDELASVADIVLPGIAYSEKSSVYVNMEGRVQQGRHALTGPGDSRDDWKIIRALSEVCDFPTLPYDNEDEIHARTAELIPNVNSLGLIETDTFFPEGSSKLSEVMSRGWIKPTPFQPVNHDFYLQGNSISRASKTMAECSKTFMEGTKNFI